MARNPNRLTALDSAFLHIENTGAHMHVASVMTFEGAPPAYDDLLDALESRLHLVPRYRQRLADVPFDQGRPVWVDDPHFNLRYHLRHTGLPAPGGDVELKRLAGRLFSQQLDRSKPLKSFIMALFAESGNYDIEVHPWQRHRDCLPYSGLQVCHAECMKTS